MAAVETRSGALSGFSTALRHCCTHPSSSCVGLLASSVATPGPHSVADAASRITMALPLFHVPQSAASVRIALGCALPWLTEAGLAVTGIYASQVAAQPIERTVGQVLSLLRTDKDSSPSFVATLTPDEAAESLESTAGSSEWNICKYASLGSGDVPVFALAPASADSPKEPKTVAACGASSLASELHETASSTCKLRDFDDFGEGLAPEWPSPA